MNALGEYLKRAVRQRWEPGKVDCCTFPGDWACTWGLGDPVAEWRGRYRSDASAIRFINRAGGLLNLWQRGLESIGLYGVNDPVAGDVGVVFAIGMTGQREQVGAIYTGDRWAFRAPAGLIFAPAEVLRVWGPRHG